MRAFCSITFPFSGLQLGEEERPPELCRSSQLRSITYGVSDLDAPRVDQRRQRSRQLSPENDCQKVIARPSDGTMSRGIDSPR
jgi:hypothetical protein